MFLHTNYQSYSARHMIYVLIKNVNIMICDSDMNGKLPNKLVTEHN